MEFELRQWPCLVPHSLGERRNRAAPVKDGILPRKLLKVVLHRVCGWADGEDRAQYELLAGTLLEPLATWGFVRL